MCIRDRNSGGGQFRVGVAHFRRQWRDQGVKEAAFRAELVAVANGPPQDAPQHIAAPFEMCIRDSPLKTGDARFRRYGENDRQASVLGKDALVQTGIEANCPRTQSGAACSAASSRVGSVPPA